VDRLRIVHAIPGRVRLKVDEVRANPTLAEAIEDRLVSVPGISWVEANPRTGSVLVVYEMESISSDTLPRLSAVLSPLIPGFSIEDLQRRAMERDTNGVRPALDTRITGFLGTLNAGLGRATGGFDLKVVVPVLLFCFGVRGLLFSDRVPFPSWYDFLWFSFGTFLALNPAVEAR